MERFSFVFLVAGLLFFALAFAVSGWIPMLSVQDLEVRTVEQMAAEPPLEFSELREQYPEAYEAAFGGKSETEAFAEALRIGHKTYIGEACWHCHSQQIRPWGNDEARFGRRSFPEEYHNELNMPPLWGTRRIGPDLIRRGGKQSNDWHVAHFYHPPDVNPVSVMPSYPWFLEADGLTPNKTGLSIIAYVQWLGSWVPTLDETIYEVPNIESSYPPSGIEWPQTQEAEAEEDADAASEDDFWGE
ncbi:MAG: cbb3-type cytochrome c oxidase subunit II [Acidobacteriota bacterium]